MKTRTKLFWTLWIASIVATLLILPYIFALQGDVLREAGLPLPVLVLAIAMQGVVTFAIASILGLLLAERTGFGLPLLTAWFERRKLEYGRTLVLSIGLGAAVGVAILVLDQFVFAQVVPPSSAVALWQGFLASFYGGICEEIIMRLFLMTLLVWAVMKLARQEQARPWTIWGAIILVSVVFGLGHLPITSAMVAITPLVIVRAVVLNGIGGVVFGYLYWKRGLESAIVSHFTADIVLHVIGLSLGLMS